MTDAGSRRAAISQVDISKAGRAQAGKSRGDYISKALLYRSGWGRIY